MDYSSTKIYVDLVNNLSSYNVPDDMESSFYDFTLTVFQKDQQEMYSKPTSWIGMCIAAASLLCVFAMVADLLHGLRNRKLWFPCNYFTMNAASLSVISVAMKLPMDTSNSMPGDVDQMAKLGSMAFLCTMMANLLPSLATMNSKELLTNITGMGVMVITLLVNVCIQIVTGVVTYREDARVAEIILPDGIDPKELGISNKDYNTIIAIVYMALLLVLLIMHTCSSLAILMSKKIIDVKYQVRHDTVSKEQQQSERLTVEKLRQNVTKYWIVAGTRSLQSISVCSVTTSAAGVICVSSTIIHIKTSISTILAMKKGDYESDYKSSVVFIFAIQSIGVIYGTIAPFCRCFAPLYFKVSIKSIRNHIEVFKVESYWTQKLYDWRKRSISFPSRSHNFKVIIEILKIVFLNVCIQFQEAVVVACKIISLVPFFFMICAFYCLKCLKNTGEAVVSRKESCVELGKGNEESCVESGKRNVESHVESGKRNEESCVESGKGNEESCVESGKRNEESPVESGKRNENLEDLRGYVLQLQDETEISGSTLKWLSISLERLIKKGEKRQHRDLIKLIEKSSDFKGVEMFDRDRFQSLPPKEYQNCWSLSVVTLTAIALSLPGIIDKSEAEKLLRSVKAGLIYVTHVEESLNTSDDYISIQKAAATLWLEIEVYRKWFGNKLQDLASRVNTNTTRDIVQSFNNIAKHMVDEVERTNTGSRDDNSVCKSICADSMYRITYTILLSDNIDNFSHQELFEHLSQMISGILAACLTNLPKVIEMKCHTCCIEKREASVQAAAKLLGETTQIINTLQDRDLPCLDPNDLPFIDKWCAYLRSS